MFDERDFYVNGVDGETGEYLDPPSFGAYARTEDHAHLASLVQQRKAGGLMKLPYGVSPTDLSATRWAVIAPEAEEAMLRDALAPLIESRRAEHGKDAVTVLTYRGQSRPKWLAEHLVADSNVNPKKVPYYLFIAGSAERIPFRFVHDLAVDYAVGRLDFDTPAEYRAYAERLVAIERSAPKRERRVTFFAPRHDFDRATQLSADLLVTPLAKKFGSTPILGTDAKKSCFADLLRAKNSERAAILFTASHGVGFSSGDPRQLSRQGALLCQDWRRVGEIDENHYFAASDIPSDADVEGLIAFHFACFGAGTPESDRFFKSTGQAPKPLAPQRFVAALPKELLRRGASAVIGHVDRAWGFSFVSPGAGTQIQHFENFLAATLDGEPIGHAMKDFADRYASIAVHLSGELERNEYEDVSPQELMNLWMQRNDAQAYMIIGDPAARLRIVPTPPPS